MHHLYRKFTSVDINEEYSKMVLVVAINLIFLICFTILFLIGTIYFTKFLIYFGILFSMGSLIFTMFSPGATILGRILAAFGLVFLFLMFYLFMKNSEYTVKLVSGSSKILFKYLGYILSFGFAFILLQSFHIFILLFIDYKKEYSYIISGLNVFFLIWLIFFCNYVYYVFISSLVTIHITKSNEENKIIKPSIINTLWSLGSIAFGSLVVAVIYCSRISVEMANERVSRNNRDDRSILIP
ncbi:MAG: hypothetical protein KC414_07065, partial [Romboutsia sp.]|nr:hypothetical protein [Romboutsia sp.]